MVIGGGKLTKLKKQKKKPATVLELEVLGELVTSLPLT
jgi:hypothetical protein